jgi:hypothetical protein
VNRYLQGTIPDAHCFFTTMLPSRVRARYAEPEKFQEKIYQVRACLFFLLRIARVRRLTNQPLSVYAEGHQSS